MKALMRICLMVLDPKEFNSDTVKDNFSTFDSDPELGTTIGF